MPGRFLHLVEGTEPPTKKTYLITVNWKKWLRSHAVAKTQDETRLDKQTWVMFHLTILAGSDPAHLKITTHSIGAKTKPGT